MPDGDNAEEYYFMLRDVDLDQEEDWRNVGFDLDDRCTVEPDFDNECRPPMRRQAPSDGNDGIDNTFGSQLFPLVDLAIPGLEDSAHGADSEGTGPVIRLRGWNGEDDDLRVDVTVTTAVYAVPPDSDGSIPTFELVNFKPQVGGMPFLPNYDGTGTDYLFLRDDTFFEGNLDQPLIRDDNAYVSGRVLSAQLPDRFELIFPSMVASLRVTLTDGLLTARISDDGMSLEDVQVGGRWAVLDMLRTAENVGLCRGEAQYDILANQLDTIADIRSQPGTGGPDVFCDAISAGVRFRADRMTLGGLVEGPALSDLCAERMMDGGMPDGGPPDAGM